MNKFFLCKVCHYISYLSAAESVDGRAGCALQRCDGDCCGVGGRSRGWGWGHPVQQELALSGHRFAVIVQLWWFYVLRLTEKLRYVWMCLNISFNRNQNFKCSSLTFAIKPAFHIYNTSGFATSHGVVFVWVWKTSYHLLTSPPPTNLLNSLSAPYLNMPPIKDPTMERNPHKIAH